MGIINLKTGQTNYIELPTNTIAHYGGFAYNSKLYLKRKEQDIESELVFNVYQLENVEQ